MKYIISESQYNRIKRRAESLKELITNTYPYLYPCDYNKSNFIFAVLHDVHDVIGIDWITDENIQDVRDFIYDNFQDWLISHWDSNCKE